MPEGKTSSRKQEFREKRRKQQQRQRLITLMIIAGVVLIVAAVLIAPSIRAAFTPVGAITLITPYARPDAQGTAAGNPNAPVKIDVYEDFQCPACRNFTEETEKQIIVNYVTPGKVYYVFHQFPFIDSTVPEKESHQAANASECAAAQGRFWDYHDMLFANWNGENTGAFSDKRLTAFAQALKLDMNAFNTCFKQNQYKSKIDQDYASGEALKVNQTPSVFVNGKLINTQNVPTFADVKAVVDQALTGK
ncbi:MAG: DsbA family protein [Omnitrophica WOR_2 bacterium]